MIRDNWVTARIQKKIKDLDKNDYLTLTTFIAKYPEFENDVNLWLDESDPSKKQGKWAEKITEIELWLGNEKRIDIHYMYTRVLELSKSFRAKKPLFDKKPVGRLAKDDITSMIARIRYLWQRLCYSIYPDLEAYFSYESYRKEEKRPDYRGMIDWPKTIMNSANTAGVPLQFVCKIPERRFDTPENLLLMVAVNWLHRDAKVIHGYTGYPKLSQEEKNLIRRVYSITDRILQTTSLHKILGKAESLSQKKFDSVAIKDLMENGEDSVRKRIDTGIIQDQNYIELLKWATRYIYFNVNKIHGDFEGIKMDTETGIHKMFEYWLLYEFVTFLESEKQLECRITQAGDFDITNNKKSITLLFNKNVRREEMQASDELTPDYLIETSTILANGKNFKSLVMDAKNYLYSDRIDDSENKMIRYILEILKSQESITKQKQHWDGVLLFPIKKWAGNENYKTAEFRNANLTVLSCMICPSQERDKIEAMIENFDKIYEEFLKPHLE